MIKKYKPYQDKTKNSQAGGRATMKQGTLSDRKWI